MKEGDCLIVTPVLHSSQTRSGIPFSACNGKARQGEKARPH